MQTKPLDLVIELVDRLRVAEREAEFFKNEVKLRNQQDGPTFEDATRAVLKTLADAGVAVPPDLEFAVPVPLSASAAQSLAAELRHAQEQWAVAAKGRDEALKLLKEHDIQAGHTSEKQSLLMSALTKRAAEAVELRIKLQEAQAERLLGVHIARNYLIEAAQEMREIGDSKEVIWAMSAMASKVNAIKEGDCETALRAVKERERQHALSPFRARVE